MALDPMQTQTSPALERDLETAIGLVWGHLGARQYRQGALLARGALALWPGQPMLLLLGAYAAGELGDGEAGDGLTAPARALLRLPEYAALAGLVVRRARGRDGETA